MARDFLAWLDVGAGGDWVDVGCGTGALSQAVLDATAPRSVVGVDSSEGFIEHARRHVADDRVRFEVGDAQAIEVPDGSADAVVSGLVLNFVPEPPRMAAEMARVSRGVAAAYVWDYAGEMQLMRYFWDTAVELDPAATPVAESARFTMCDPHSLAAIWDAAGLRDVDTCAIDVPTVFADFDDYWSPFLGGQGPAPAYCMSLEPAARDALHDALHDRLPAEPDGSIHLLARAWAVRGAVV